MTTFVFPLTFHSLDDIKQYVDFLERFQLTGTLYIDHSVLLADDIMGIFEKNWNHVIYLEATCSNPSSEKQMRHFLFQHHLAARQILSSESCSYGLISK